MATAQPYLKGISTGDMGEALRVLLGEDANGLSANVVSRLKTQWAAEHEAWKWKDIARVSGLLGLRAIKGFHDEALHGEWKGPGWEVSLARAA